MKVISARNVNDALPMGVHLLRTEGVRRDSRNGPVVVYPGPVCTIYQRPLERVLRYPQRDANPFFHLFESMWMLAGRDDVRSVARYVSRMKTYSDDGKTLHGAYGKRWRGWFTGIDPEGWFKVDQLQWAIKRLRKDPNDRRVVIGMWDPGVDPLVADGGGRDVPCNTQLYLWVSDEGSVCMTVMCRSNDMIWGAYGANAVHFSYLLEHVACSLQRPVGAMWQISNNYHAYVDKLEALGELDPDQPYSSNPEWTASPVPLHQGDLTVFDQDLAMLLDEDVSLGLRTAWLRKVFIPVIRAHEAYKDKADPERHEKAIEIVAQCRAPDWRLACTEWLERRRAEAQRAADDGVKHEP